MAYGRVEWFDETKGFGSIRDEEGRDFFVRYMAFQKNDLATVREGTNVEFESHQNENGREALNVRLIEVAER